MRQVLPHIRDWRIDTLLILSGDHLYRMDYRKFLKRHFDTDADITVSAIPIPPDSAGEFGLLKVDEAGRIIEFREKPKGDELEAMRVDTTPLGLTADEARARPIASSSSMKMMLGAAALALAKRSRTRAAPTPTMASTNSDAERLKNGRLDSPATARASRVLPVPGAPTSRMPCGICAPKR